MELGCGKAQGGILRYIKMDEMLRFFPVCLVLSLKQIEQAQATASKIEAELKDLQATLKNIEDARPFDELSVDDVIIARPEISKTVEVRHPSLLLSKALSRCTGKALTKENAAIIVATYRSARVSFGFYRRWSRRASGPSPATPKSSARSQLFKLRTTAATLACHPTRCEAALCSKNETHQKTAQVSSVRVESCRFKRSLVAGSKVD